MLCGTVAVAATPREETCDKEVKVQGVNIWDWEGWWYGFVNNDNNNNNLYQWWWWSLKDGTLHYILEPASPL